MGFAIEELFQDFKMGGYNLEGTTVTGQHLCARVLLISLAYTTATFEGQAIKRMGMQKDGGRVNEAGRNHHRHRHFYIGLYGQTWVQLMNSCAEMVNELLLLSPHKRPSSQRGMRAMKLIHAAL